MLLFLDDGLLLFEVQLQRFVALQQRFAQLGGQLEICTMDTENGYTRLAKRSEQTAANRCCGGEKFTPKSGTHTYTQAQITCVVAATAARKKSE